MSDWQFLGGVEPADEETALLVCMVANQQRFANFQSIIDARRHECPECGCGGFNSGMGAVVFICGGEAIGDDFFGCQSPQTLAEAQS